MFISRTDFQLLSVAAGLPPSRASTHSTSHTNTSKGVGGSSACGGSAAHASISWLQQRHGAARWMRRVQSARVQAAQALGRSCSQWFCVGREAESELVLDRATSACDAPDRAAAWIGLFETSRNSCGMSASSSYHLFRGHFSSVKMPERTDSELSQLTRQHLKSHGADWEILEPFINRVLRPWESSQVLLCALCF